MVGVVALAPLLSLDLDDVLVAGGDIQYLIVAVLAVGMVRVIRAGSVPTIDCAVPAGEHIAILLAILVVHVGFEEIDPCGGVGDDGVAVRVAWVYGLGKDAHMQTVRIAVLAVSTQMLQDLGSIEGEGVG